ncbi:SDR family NAD(P)-dependent oxidoreductase [Streptococcus macacae]|uniref:Oxidoreductase, short chain dehydrogenase/reductase family protein n=1 Tax=Streptococcus macacae NCTC 11558 TaxID=764298 RepID=G5JW19_9STRE|nr:SDR family oxidoreductase [Streptococcus macacae]EHJ53127.1 oxidoreductase, short chain dehydrogenase/reductase family protein [Streptococcus macacae NCTC 11558]SUN79352.1 oxidoreductase [Streptococcus macacae NCTC 11558]
MSNKNLLLIGSESHVCKDFAERYGKHYDHIVGIDLPQTSDKLDDYLSVDFRDNSAFEKIASFLKELSMHFSQVVFATAVNYMNDAFGVTIKDWEATFDVNVKAALFSMKAIYDYLDDTVSIVFIASQNGVVAHSQRIDYGSSKSALIHLARNLSVDYALVEDKDIRINTISPSYVKNEANKDLLNSYFGQRLLARIPYRRFVDLEDVSHSISFLLSDQSKSIRGQNLVLDYGYTIV